MAKLAPAQTTNEPAHLSRWVHGRICACMWACTWLGRACIWAALGVGADGVAERCADAGGLDAAGGFGTEGAADAGGLDAAGGFGTDGCDGGLDSSAEVEAGKVGLGLIRPDSAPLDLTWLDCTWLDLPWLHLT